jgi:hypothetical protein
VGGFQSDLSRLQHGLPIQKVRVENITVHGVLKAGIIDAHAIQQDKKVNPAGSQLKFRAKMPIHDGLS